MKNHLFTLFVLLLFINCKETKSEEKSAIVNTSTTKKPLFKVSKAKGPIVIDGKTNELDWSKTEARSFDYFYNVEKPTDQQKTTFSMLWDETNIYVLFKCADRYITAREKTRDGKPYFDDCAEIFLTPVPETINMHMGFEVNLYKTSNDFLFISNFYKGKKGVLKAFNPNFDVEVTVDGTINDNTDIDKGWTMEMAIPIDLFFKLDTYAPVQEGNRWTFLAVRQERNEVEGSRRVTSTIFPLDKTKVDVHEPTVFGQLEFVK